MREQYLRKLVCKTCVGVTVEAVRVVVDPVVNAMAVAVFGPTAGAPKVFVGADVPPAEAAEGVPSEGVVGWAVFV